MLKAIIATAITILSGLNYLKPAAETYTTLNGFYTIEWRQEITPTRYRLYPIETSYSDISIFDARTKEFSERVDIESPTALYIKATTTEITIEEYYNNGNYYIPYVVSINEIRNYVYFNNIQVSNDIPFTFNKNNDVNGGDIINKSYNLKDFNPMGFSNYDYGKQMLISNAITTPIDLLGDLFATYNNNVVISWSAIWINANGTEIETETGTRAVVNGNDYKCYQYTEMIYFDVNEMKQRNILTSSAVYATYNNSGNINYYLTKQLNNKDGYIYIAYNKNNGTRYPIESFFTNYGTINGNGIVLNGNIGDVFNLLSQCFMGIGGFFGIALLPGITLGALFFLPFIVSLIIWLINLFKRH